MPPLTEDYLAYPHRRYGMDQSRYDWRPVEERGPIAWPGGAAVAAMIVAPLEFHMLDPSAKPFKHPGAMVTPYPDLRHFTTRDYGLRVGAFRILDALKSAGLKATFPVNAVLLTRARPLIEAVVADGHELAAYGVDTDHIHWSGLPEGEERRYVAETRAAFDRAGFRPRTWMSPARQQSPDTLDLIAESGFDVCLDWEADTAPLPLRTRSGEVWSVPLSNELDDRCLLIDRHQSEEDWSRCIAAAVDLQKGEAARHGGSVLGFSLTSYVAGQPFRLWAVREILSRLAADAAVWTAGACDITDAAKAGAAKVGSARAGAAKVGAAGA